jgi:outer membrane lipoprotein-sorting protein
MRGAFVLAAALFGAWGCAALVEPPSPAAVAPVAPEEIRQILGERNARFRSLRSLASVSYRGREGAAGFEEAVVVQRPDRLRLETLTSVGAILVVTANREEISGLHLRERVFVRGRSTAQNLFRYTRIPLSLEEITALLLGLPPAALDGAWTIHEGWLERQAGGGRETILFDPESRAAARWDRYGAGGELELSVLFGDFRDSPAGSFPHRIVVEAPQVRRRLEIRYRDPEINPELSAGLFAQERPPYAKEIPIEALRGGDGS